MPLRGRIEDYGLADVLQLVGKANKAGILRCDNEVDDIRLLIESHWILSVEVDGRPNDAKLGTRLAQAGIITESDLGNALARRAQTSEPITEILLDQGLADEASLEHHASLLATETLFEIFTWRSGTYEFLEGSVQAPRTFIKAMNLDEILLQGIVLMDDWPTIVERIPTTSARVAERWDLPPEAEPSIDAMFGIGEPQDSGPDIGENERLIYSLCELGTEVQTVLARAPFHRFETYRCLSRLIGEQFLRLS